MSMNIYAKKGDFVIVTKETAKNGYSADKEKVSQHLIVGMPYEVEKTTPHDFCTDVYLKEFPSRIFNSVNFEDFEK